MDLDRALSQFVSIITLSLGLVAVMLTPLLAILAIGRLGRSLGRRVEPHAHAAGPSHMSLPTLKTDQAARVEPGGSPGWLPPIRRRKAH